MPPGADPEPAPHAADEPAVRPGTRNREELERLKLEAELYKLQLEARELGRPQFRRMPVVVSTVTAIVAVFGAGLQFWISRHEYQLAELERQRAALAEQAATVQAERAEIEKIRAEIDARRAEEQNALAQEQATATETRIAQTQEQIDAAGKDLDQALDAVQALEPASPKQGGQIAAAQKAIRRASMHSPSLTVGNELQLARDLEAAVDRGDYEEAAAGFDALEKSHYSGVGYSAYPDAALALDQSGDADGSLQVLDGLQKRMQQDAAERSGYLAPGRPPRAGIKAELAELAEKATDPRVKAKAQALADKP